MSKPASIAVDISNEEGRKAFAEASAKAYASNGGLVQRATADNRMYRNVGTPNISVRDSFTRDDYDYFRPDEAIPVRDREAIAMCMQAYDRFPLVRSTIDLMADFACKGIDIVHPSPRVQKFGREWFKKVGGAERSERILSLLYRAGNAVLRRLTARLPDTTMDSLRATAADKKFPKAQRLKANEIPISYVIYDPRALEVIGGDLSIFVGENALEYGVRVPDELAKKLKSPKGRDAGLVGKVPPSLLDQASNDKLVRIPKEGTIQLHYKKDDFQVWARPLLYPLLDDLKMLDKLRLADRAALDSAINRVRLWQLGSLETNPPIMPTPAGIERLSEMLAVGVAGGSFDLVWGPDLNFKETSSDMVDFLGSEKYQQTLASIYAGLGVPPTLTGTAGDQGFTNNFVSLRVLVERLEYGRQLLIRMWEAELALVQQTMGFREAFRLTFDIPTLSDDSAEKKLLIELVDRDLVSAEFVQERFGADPDIETVRVRRESRKRKDGSLPPKAGPLHSDSRHKNQLELAAMTSGAYAPSQFGVELQPKNPGEEPPGSIVSDFKPAEQPSGSPGGRPKGQKDSEKRKQKRVKPRQAAASIADATAWGTWAMSEAESVLRASFLDARGRGSLRELTQGEWAEFEGIKFAVLCATPIGARPTVESVRAFLAQPVPAPEPVRELVQAATAKFVEREGREPPPEQARQIRAAAYAIYAFDPQDGVNDYTEE